MRPYEDEWQASALVFSVALLSRVANSLEIICVLQKNSLVNLHFLLCIQRHVGRLTADMPSGAGVCVLSMNGDLPLGFGTSAKSTAEIHMAPTESISFYHHADVGEYLREEADLV